MRRSRTEVDGEILNAINQGIVKPTPIMYACKLSWKAVKTRITGLLDRGLVVEVKTSSKLSPIHYKLTERGKKFVEAWNDIREMLT